jgi:hypothetical protein
MQNIEFKPDTFPPAESGAGSPFEGGVAGPLYNYYTNSNTGRGG